MALLQMSMPWCRSCLKTTTTACLPASNSSASNPSNPVKQRMKSLDARFVGNGNTWVADGHYRGWRVTCSRCGAVKLVTGHHDSTMPPHLIVKKLSQSGWYIDKKPVNDVCP